MLKTRLCNHHGARRNAGLPRRVALASLLLGWSVFWLVAVLQPCCKLALAPSAPAAAGVALHTSDAGHHDSGHHPADPAENCGGLLSIAHAAAVAVTATPAPQSTSDKALAADDGFAPLQSHALARTNNALLRHRPLPPPRAVAAFHQRTARILV
jgi:hypothetical protein